MSDLTLIQALRLRAEEARQKLNDDDLELDDLEAGVIEGEGAHAQEIADLLQKTVRDARAILEDHGPREALDSLFRAIGDEPSFIS